MKQLMIFIILFVTTIANASVTPEWVLGRGHYLYDPAVYLYGIGYSKENTVSASESARAELIKSIRVKVNSTINDYHSTDKSFSEASIKSETDFLLEGSQVKDGWYDDDKEIFYSLVVVERKYVLDTLEELIDNTVSKNNLTLRQADTYYNNGDIIKALVYYYDGYVESSKLFPYIQTHKSVNIVQDKTLTQTNHNLLFKEKIQSIVDNISLEKVNTAVTVSNIDLSVRAVYKGQGINDFPIKFYNGYNRYSEKVFCGMSGHCNVNPKIEQVVHQDETDIFVKATVDLPTFEKYFNHHLKKDLFGRLELMGVSFKAKKIVPKPIKKEVVVVKKEKKQEQRGHVIPHIHVPERNLTWHEKIQVESDRMALETQRELDRMKPRPRQHRHYRPRQEYKPKVYLDFDFRFGKNGRLYGNNHNNRHRQQWPYGAW